MPDDSGHSRGGTERFVHPLKRLKQQAKERKKKAEKEKVHCPECGTTVWKDSMEEAIDVQEQHDGQMHGGERVTLVNGIRPPEFSEEEKQQIRDAVQSLQADTDRSGGRR
jgi:acetyl-CoA carboxylase beta subunit